MPRISKDYSDIAPQIVEAYNKARNLKTVSDMFHISTATVSMICRTNGVKLNWRGVKNCAKNKKPIKRLPKNTVTDSCQFCHSYSKTSVCEGWCLSHRRMVCARNREHCFK